MKPYRWMVDYTTQEEWVDGQGQLLWLAFFFSEMGSGLYLVSLYLNFWEGALTGWLLTALLGGGLHMLYLGKPERAWRALLRPGKSELSRGLIITILFLGVGALQIAPSLDLFAFLPWQSDLMFFRIIMTILCFFSIAHGFMTMNVMAAIPFWNSAILPVLSIASGVWVGTQLCIGVSLGTSNQYLLRSLEPVAVWALFAYTVLILFYLWNAGHATKTVQASLKFVLKGDLAKHFYIGVALIGLLIPIAITLAIGAGGGATDGGVLYLRLICVLIGDATLRYVITRAGRYAPLIYSNAVPG